VLSTVTGLVISTYYHNRPFGRNYGISPDKPSLGDLPDCPLNVSLARYSFRTPLVVVFIEPMRILLNSSLTYAADNMNLGRSIADRRTSSVYVAARGAIIATGGKSLTVLRGIVPLACRLHVSLSHRPWTRSAVDSSQVSHPRSGKADTSDEAAVESAVKRRSSDAQIVLNKWEKSFSP
jgi:hypothetical protein